jgi:hypothetical protein
MAFNDIKVFRWIQDFLILGCREENYLHSNQFSQYFFVILCSWSLSYIKILHFFKWKNCWIINFKCRQSAKFKRLRANKNLWLNKEIMLTVWFCCLILFKNKSISIFISGLKIAELSINIETVWYLKTFLQLSWLNITIITIM